MHHRLILLWLQIYKTQIRSQKMSPGNMEFSCISDSPRSWNIIRTKVERIEYFIFHLFINVDEKTFYKYEYRGCISHSWVASSNQTRWAFRVHMEIRLFHLLEWRIVERWLRFAQPYTPVFFSSVYSLHSSTLFIRNALAFHTETQWRGFSFACWVLLLFHQLVIMIFSLRNHLWHQYYAAGLVGDGEKWKTTHSLANKKRANSYGMKWYRARFETQNLRINHIANTASDMYGMCACFLHVQHALGILCNKTHKKRRLTDIQHELTWISEFEATECQHHTTRWCTTRFNSHILKQEHARNKPFIWVW